MKAIAIGFALSLAAVGCSSSSGEACSSTSESCPSSAPTYSSDVAPILQTYCAKCHAAGGEESDKPLTSYSAAKALASDVQVEVSGCDMPPSDESQPTIEERNLILVWIACGMPEQ